MFNNHYDELDQSNSQGYARLISKIDILGSQDYTMQHEECVEGVYAHYFQHRNSEESNDPVPDILKAMKVPSSIFHHRGEVKEGFHYLRTVLYDPNNSIDEVKRVGKNFLSYFEKKQELFGERIIRKEYGILKKRLTDSCPELKENINQDLGWISNCFLYAIFGLILLVCVVL